MVSLNLENILELETMVGYKFLLFVNKVFNSELFSYYLVSVHVCEVSFIVSVEVEYGLRKIERFRRSKKSIVLGIALVLLIDVKNSPFALKFTIALGSLTFSFSRECITVSILKRLHLSLTFFSIPGSIEITFDKMLFRGNGFVRKFGVGILGISLFFVHNFV